MGLTSGINGVQVCEVLLDTAGSYTEKGYFLSIYLMRSYLS
jgi:hypothetical protein